MTHWGILAWAILTGLCAVAWWMYCNERDEKRRVLRRVAKYVRAHEKEQSRRVALAADIVGMEYYEQVAALAERVGGTPPLPNPRRPPIAGYQPLPSGSGPVNPPPRNP